MFQKICFAKSGEFLQFLTMCLLSVPCSGVPVYICSPQSDSCSLVAGIPQPLKFPNTSQDVVIPLHGRLLLEKQQEHEVCHVH